MSQRPISDGTDAIAALLAYGERMESDTPRTDAENWIRDMGFEKWVSIDFARELERELAAAIKQRDEARRLYRALLDGIKDAVGPRENEGGGA